MQEPDLKETFFFTNRFLNLSFYVPICQVGSGVFDPTVPDPEHACASNTTAWELTLLANHYHDQAAR